MTPQTQLISHNPPAKWGDCWRTCIAMILDLPAEEVPHFLDDGGTNEDGLKRAREWLQNRGLDIVYFEMPADSLKEHIDFMFGGAHYIMSGMSNNYKEACHCVVAKGHFQMVWDPSLLRDGNPPKPHKETNTYSIEFIVKR